MEQGLTPATDKISSAQEEEGGHQRDGPIISGKTLCCPCGHWRDVRGTGMPEGRISFNMVQGDLESYANR